MATATHAPPSPAGTLPWTPARVEVWMSPGDIPQLGKGARCGWEGCPRPATRADVIGPGAVVLSCDGHSLCWADAR